MMYRSIKHELKYTHIEMVHCMSSLSRRHPLTKIQVHYATCRTHQEYTNQEHICTDFYFTLKFE